jgi:2-oxoglutarate/2-oxoacid ferredoxin oxidoreductase subunit beta
VSATTETTAAAPSCSLPFVANDYKTALKPVWCPGCGDFGVVASVYKAFAELQLPPWETVVVSGIGCSSRLPGYVATYGFNSLHGRALPLAIGAKVARPELHVVAVGGDGDGFAIGGNHFMHAARRNMDLAYFIMDNEIYGLTKGQAAPTTPTGDKTKSTMYGNPEPAVDPCELAISVGATFVARAFSGDPKTLVSIMTAAMRHHGFAFVNILSPCVTWRGDDQFKEIRAKLQKLPESRDRTHRPAALAYTRETDVMTTGILYEVAEPTFLDRLGDVKRAASNGKAAPTVRELAERFYPRF